MESPGRGFIRALKVWTAMNKIQQFYLQNSTPVIAVFELTEKCNLDCPHCYAPRTYEDSPVEKLIEVFKQLRHAGIIAVELTGGEPTLYPNFRKVAKFLFQFFFTEISTNLTGDERILNILSNFDYVRGSIYGYHTYDSYQEGLGEKVLRNAIFLSKNSKAFQVGFQATKYNIHEYPIVKEKLKRYGIKIDVGYIYSASLSRDSFRAMPTPEQVIKYINPKLIYRRGKANRCVFYRAISFRCDLALTRCPLFPDHVEKDWREYFTCDVLPLREVVRAPSPCDGCPYEACRSKYCPANNVIKYGKVHARDHQRCQYIQRLYEISERVEYIDKPLC